MSKPQNIKDWIIRSLRHITQDYSKSDDDPVRLTSYGAGRRLGQDELMKLRSPDVLNIGYKWGQINNDR